ncbi:hypothetical protein DT73_13125 [Mangrovibacter sp. MFB070]|uniref:hypothetical protein n=1 Tax=Mangrovibacter sp. MFB070 TaxID=1224318 RepID=UPI0004DA6612|nr:hypothetical protein [Mangrovibacter sp. MFB070]KEA51870.1 hypothetical protein DT73_13125 [Mangrovibacter sp. MFB070]
MKETIYIGETIIEAIPASSTLKIGNSNQTLYEYSNTEDIQTTQTIDTSTWEEGTFAYVLNNNGTITINNITVIDPMKSADELSYAKMMVKEIDSIIENRAKNATTQITINNKTIVNDSIDSLYKLRALFIERINRLQKKNSAGIFKSITILKKGRN